MVYTDDPKRNSNEGGMRPLEMDADHHSGEFEVKDYDDDDDDDNHLSNKNNNNNDHWSDEDAVSLLDSSTISDMYRDEEARDLSLRVITVHNKDCYPVYCGVAALVILLIAAIFIKPPPTVPSDGSTSNLLCEADTPDHLSSWHALLKEVNDTNYGLRCTEPRPWGKNCSCANPLIPRIPDASSSYTKMWKEAVQINLRRIQEFQRPSLDVVLLGDSITEHWYGASFGKPFALFENNTRAYEGLFDPAHGGSVSGFALGISGDVCPQLLYRIHNGELDPKLQPAVWWLLIGTNDRGGSLCQNNQVVAGIIAIVREIRKRRPDAVVVINSLLPRGSAANRLVFWEDGYVPINEALECYADGQDEHVQFFNATSIFLSASGLGVNQTLMPDELHPAEEGSWVWGRAIVDRVQQIISDGNAG